MNPSDFSSIDLAVIQQLVNAIPEEMGAVLGRSAYSTNIKERKDYSCALFNSEGKLLAQAAHIPVHLGAMPRSVEAVLDDFPNLSPGDVIMLNDPFRGGSHLPDITLVSPLFFESGDRISGYAATRAHHADVGGMSAGSLPNSTSIYQEGLRIPPVRLVENGNLKEDILRILCANSRNPIERKGDIQAQLQSHTLADIRWKEVGERQGTSRMEAMGAALLEVGERSMKKVLAKLPLGTWSAEERLEHADKDQEFTYLRATLRTLEDTVVVDFSESDDAVSGSLNAVHAICESAMYYAFLCLLNAEHPDEVLPVNHGTFLPLTCITRKGSVLNAEIPHAVAGGNVETSQRIVDLVFKLVKQLVPETLPAQSQGTMNNVTMGGMDEEGNPFSYYETLGGGAGASRSQNGADAVQVHMTNTLNTPVEALEFSAPLFIREVSIRENSGGGGLFRGGNGLIREWEMRIPVEVTLLTERRILSPAGSQGGGGGCPGKQSRILSDGTCIPLAGKGAWVFEKGDRLRVETPGGGGYGQPVS